MPFWGCITLSIFRFNIPRGVKQLLDHLFRSRPRLARKTPPLGKRTWNQRWAPVPFRTSPEPVSSLQPAWNEPCISPPIESPIPTNQPTCPCDRPTENAPRQSPNRRPWSLSKIPPSLLTSIPSSPSMTSSWPVTKSWAAQSIFETRSATCTSALCCCRFLCNRSTPLGRNIPSPRKNW